MGAMQNECFEDQVRAGLLFKFGVETFVILRRTF